jgi:hypothetical protein
MAKVKKAARQSAVRSGKSSGSGFGGHLRELIVLSLWPVIYFWPYLISDGLTPGNDFHTLYYRFKLYLVDLLSHGWSPPVWSPTEAAGFPFRANPFTAAWYPLNFVLPYFYEMNGGYSEWDHVLFTLVAFSLFATGTFVWLRILGEPRSGALLASLILATSLKMSELLRFPNAAHTAAWIPWLLAGITLCFRRRGPVRGLVICFVASYCLLTAGYPYYAFYTQFLAGPWTLLLLWKSSRRSLSQLPDDAWGSSPKALAGIAAGCGTALFCCLSYLREMRQMLSATTDRQGGDWEYGTIHEWSGVDVLGSLIYPPRACTEGWYFFGISAFLVIALFILEQLSDRSDQSRHSRRFLIIVGSFWVFITLITLGKVSPLFYILWKYYPGVSSLRVWSRMNVILLPILSLLLARSWNWWVTQLSSSQEPARRRIAARLAGTAVAILLLQLILMFCTTPEMYWTQFFQSPETPLATLRPALNWSVLVLGLIGAGILILQIRRVEISPSMSERMGPPFLMMLFVCALETCGYGWLQWSNLSTVYQTHREIVDIPTRLREGFTRPRVPTMSTVSLGARSQLGILSNWYYDSYVQFLKTHVPHPDDLAVNTEQFHAVPGLMEMLGGTDGRRLFFVPRLDYATPQEFVTAAREFEQMHQCHTEVQMFDGDHLRVTAISAAPGFLCYIDNWDPVWKCSVNGTPVTIKVLMGTFKAVSLSPGTSDVLFYCTGERLDTPAASTHPDQN